MFQPIPTTDHNIDEYWKARILYVKNSGHSDKHYKVDGTYRPINLDMAPSKYHVDWYEYALLLED